MADRFPAQIWIGGKISRTALLYPNLPDDNTTILQGLIGALHQDGASHEYGEAVIPENCNVELPLDDVGWKRFLDNEGRFNLKCDHAVNGEFSETEVFCLERDIAFDRWSDDYVYFRPGMNSPVMTYADSAGKEVVCGDTVRKAIEKLDAFNNVVGTGDPRGLSADDWFNFIVGLRLLHDACPRLPPKLESFEITS